MTPRIKRLAGAAYLWWPLLPLFVAWGFREHPIVAYVALGISSIAWSMTLVRLRTQRREIGLLREELRNAERRLFEERWRARGDDAYAYSSANVFRLDDTQLSGPELVDAELVDAELVDAELVDTELVDTEPVDAELVLSAPPSRTILNRARYWLRRIGGRPEVVLLKHLRMKEPDAPDVFSRTPHIEFGRVPPFEPGIQFDVLVYLDTGEPLAGESGERVEIEVALGQERLEFMVWLVGSSSHFAIQHAVQTLWATPQANRSSTALFRVGVKPDALLSKEAFLSALFSYEGRPSGRVTRVVPLAGFAAGASVSEDGRPGELATLFAAPAPTGVRSALVEIGKEFPAVLEARRGIAADLTIQVVAADRIGRRFTCRVRTPLIPDYSQGQEQEWTLPNTTDKWIRMVMQQFTEANLSPWARRASLNGAGKDLFDAAPDIFRLAFWKIVDDPQALARLRTIAVISDEPYIPWELMVPSRPRPDQAPEERRALGIEFLLSRWTSSDAVQPPQSLPLADSFVVAPTDSGLANAEAEAALVMRLFRGLRVSPASIEKLDTLAARGGRSLLHFVCHGTSDDGQQTLMLENHEPVQPFSLRGMPNLGAAIRATRPLVFLNACEVGRLAPGLIGASGFAEVFMNLGAGGVVAALWSVEDNLAHMVADEFYKRVKAEPDTPYSAILRDLRMRSYLDESGEDTWAAYCFYGDPLAAASSPVSERMSGERA